MKKILAKMIAPIFVFGLILACDDEEITSSFDTLDIPPVVGDIIPNGAVKVAEGFDIKVYVTDGEKSPLASVSVVLRDTVGNTYGELTQSVSGTSDSVVWASADNTSATLAVGYYEIDVIATDAANLSSDKKTQGFTVFDLPFAASYPSMYILGSFTGWGGAADGSDREKYKFDLIADNLWQLKGVDLLDGDEFKFSVNPDFDGTDANNEDWSDKDCDGIMESKSGGSQDGNTGCGFKGNFDILFNDVSFAYTMTATVETAQNLDALYLLTSRMGFVASDDEEFSLDADNSWLLAETLLTPGDQIFFSEDANLGSGGKVYGDADASDTTATAGGPAYVVPSNWTEGYYSVQFNDDTEGYKFTFIRGLFPDNLFLVGGSTGAGWDENNVIQFEKLSDGVFRTYNYLDITGGGMKFLPQEGSYDGDYGDGGDGTGGTIEQDGEENAVVAANGFYRIDVDFINGTWSATLSNFGIIGSATAGGWDSDTDMTLVSATRGSVTWSITADLVVGEMKFRENDAWTINYGDWDPEDGILDLDPNGDGANINVPTAGNFTITLVLDSENGYTYTIE